MADNASPSIALTNDIEGCIPNRVGLFSLPNIGDYLTKPTSVPVIITYKYYVILISSLSLANARFTVISFFISLFKLKKNTLCQVIASSEHCSVKWRSTSGNENNLNP